MKRAAAIFLLVMLSGTAHAAGLVLSPASLSFDRAGDKTLTVRNSCDAPIAIDRVGLAPGSDGFALEPWHARVLQSGESYQLHVASFRTAGARRRSAPAAPSRRRGARGASARRRLLALDADGLLPARGRRAHPRRAARARTGWCGRSRSARRWCRWPRPAFCSPTSIAALPRRRGNGGMQFVQHAVWIPPFGIEYYVGVDGLSITMVLLTALISTIAILASFGIDKQVRGYFALFLLLETRHARHLRRARLLPLLRLLGADAGADVLPHRHLGRAAQGVRGDQVLPLHAGRLGADPAGADRALLPLGAHHARRRHAGAPHLRHGQARLRQRLGGARALDALRPATDARGVGRLLRRLRHQDPHVPAAHLAARCARRGADGDQRHPRRRFAQDGHLRHPARELRHAARGDAVGGDDDGACSAPSTSCTARFAPSPRPISSGWSPTRR